LAARVEDATCSSSCVELSRIETEVQHKVESEISSVKAGVERKVESMMDQAKAEIASLEKEAREKRELAEAELV
jgi:hypothetical protein